MIEVCRTLQQEPELGQILTLTGLCNVCNKTYLLDTDHSQILGKSIKFIR